ncbi:MAG: HPr(Ser) kinase/phosphatase [Acholeplasmataceae bacterium]
MTLKVKQLIEDLNLTILSGEETLERKIKAEMLSRPGVELAGFFDFYEPERIVLIGSKEATFMNLLDRDVCIERVEKMLSQKPPCIVFSVNVKVQDFFFDIAKKHNVALLKSPIRTTAISSMLYSYLHSKFAPRTSMHGVLVDIHGMGTLITGKSGVGKSETALELIKRGHILVSDDLVEIFEAAHGVLVGSAPKLIERYIEIRGIGIVDVVSMFGAGAYRENKKIRLVVELEPWQKGKVYDRIGLETETIKIFNTEIVKITIPILPGRNVATLVESAAMNQKLKHLGHDAAKNLVDEVSRQAGRRKDKDND